MGCWALETDWAAWGSMIQAGAAVVMMVIAGLGLNTWKKQLKGTKEQDLAEEVLTATYRFVEALRQVRSPFVPGAELDAVVRRHGESDAALDARRPYGTVEPRIERLLLDDYVQLRALLFRVQALYGEAEAGAIRRLLDVVFKLRQAALDGSTAAVLKVNSDEMLRKMFSNNHGFDAQLQALSDNHMRELERVSTLLWEMIPDDDISVEIASARDGIEGHMKRPASFANP